MAILSSLSVNGSKPVWSPKFPSYCPGHSFVDRCWTRRASPNARLRPFRLAKFAGYRHGPSPTPAASPHSYHVAGGSSFCLCHLWGAPNAVLPPGVIGYPTGWCYRSPRLKAPKFPANRVARRQDTPPSNMKRREAQRPAPGPNALLWAFRPPNRSKALSGQLGAMGTRSCPTLKSSSR